MMMHVKEEQEANVVCVPYIWCCDCCSYLLLFKIYFHYSFNSVVTIVSVEQSKDCPCVVVI